MPHPDPNALSYVFVFRDGHTLNEAECLAAGGFAAVMQRPGLDSVVVTVHGEPWLQIVIRDRMRPIFGRLWVHTLAPTAGGYTDKGRWLRAVCCGWQETVAGRNRKTLVWVTHGGVFLADRDLDAVAES